MDWISYTSYFQYTFGALAINEFTDNSYDCPYPPSNPMCALYDGNTILSGLFLREDNLYISIGILCGFALVFRLLSLIALWLIRYKPT